MVLRQTERPWFRLASLSAAIFPILLGIASSGAAPATEQPEAIYSQWLSRSGLAKWISFGAIVRDGERWIVRLQAVPPGTTLFGWYVSLRSELRESLDVDIQNQLFFRLLRISNTDPDKLSVEITD